ncbi:hypothetical protein [Klebsiella sp. BIGb0407]|uniref:hypothetical protein n=1 Tax=Klebsiella sp. BIGb0407 TaxID=2940603 RepID=UPI002169F0AA|nr:hypothetical protein [Klebsiella sp. BIGb0407]MCS3433672.1 hypothetical protein [Klebsiella sp. BIGb0407]
MSNNTEAKTIMMDSPAAASIQTVTGWVDRDGRFWGNDEYQARWCGATHRKCKEHPDDHPIHEIRSYCEICHKLKREAHFATLERVVWGGEPLVIFDDDTYFFDMESLADYCLDNSVLPSELQLVICSPNYPAEFDIEQHCENEFPEDGDISLLSKDIQGAVAALNKAIKASPPISWSGSDQVAIVSDDILDDEQKAEILVNRANKLEASSD